MDEKVKLPEASVSSTVEPRAATLKGLAVEVARVPTLRRYPVPVDALFSLMFRALVAPVSDQFQVCAKFPLLIEFVAPAAVIEERETLVAGTGLVEVSLQNEAPESY